MFQRFIVEIEHVSSGSRKGVMKMAVLIAWFLWMAKTFSLVSFSMRLAKLAKRTWTRFQKPHFLATEPQLPVRRNRTCPNLRHSLS